MRFNFGGHFRVFLQPHAHVVFALADFIAIVAVPRAGFFDDADLIAPVDQLAFAAYAFAVEDVELGLAERRRHFVFNHFHAGFVAQDLVAFFNLADAADIEAHGGVELERVAAGGGFRTAEHHADLHADLVDEHHQSVGFLNVAGELAQGLAHQAGLQTYVAVAHFAFDFRFRHQRGHGIDHHHVHTAGAHQHIADFQRLLACVRLRYHQLFHLHAQLARVNRVERVFRIDKGTHTAVFLALRDGFQTQRGFTGRLRPKDFHNAPARQTAHAQRQIHAQRAGGNHFQVFILMAAVHLHDGAFAEILFNLRQRGGQSLCFIV